MTDHTEIKDPVIVTGAGRSGKSLLAKILAASGEFATFGEPRLLWDFRLPNRNHDRVSYSDIDENYCAEVRRRVFHALSKQDINLRYLDNLSHHALRIPFLFKVFPNVKVVHIVRNYRNAVPEMLSLWKNPPKVGVTIKKHFLVRPTKISWHAISEFFQNYFYGHVRGVRRFCGPRVPGMESLECGGDLSEIVAFQWSKIVQIARADLKMQSRNQWLEVQFEDLIKNPEKILENICSFLHVRDQEKIISKGKIVIRPENGNGLREHLDYTQWEKIEEIVRREFEESYGELKKI